MFVKMIFTTRVHVPVESDIQCLGLAFVWKDMQYLRRIPVEGFGGTDKRVLLLLFNWLNICEMGLRGAWREGGDVQAF